VFGKNWLLAVQLQEKYDLIPLQQTAKQTSLTYCHCRNILRSRECKKFKQFILLLLLPLLVVVASAAAVVVVVVLLVVLMVFVFFKRLKHTLNDSGIGTRSILPKQFGAVTVLTLRGSNLSVIEGKIKGGFK
jgi:fatty acid desaturase